MHWCTGGKVDEKKAAGNKALATNCFFNILHFTRQLACDAKHGTAYQLHTCSQCKEKVRENIGTHLQCTEELGRSVQNVLQLQCPLHSAYLQSTLQCYSASSQFAKDTQYQYTMHCAQLQCRVLNERIQYISRLVQDLKCTMCRIGQCIGEQNRANTVEQPATVHSSLPVLAFQKKKKIHFFLSRIEMGFFRKRTCSISDCLTNSLNRKEGWLRRKYETHNTHILCSMYCTLWVHGYMGKGQGYVRTKEINVSHIISVCLVVIARKRENILSRQKLLQVAFSRQDAIVQQQKSSADVKTAINVTNMTLVFLFLVMKMMGMARAIG